MIVSFNRTAVHENGKIANGVSPTILIDKAETFPERLFGLLLDERNKKIIRWNKDGTQFSVVNRQKLCSNVLPRHFESTSGFQYGSFTRKLSRWGFKRSTSGMDTRIFSHPLFKRDEPILCRKMNCKIIIRNAKNKVEKNKKSVDSKPISSSNENAFVIASNQFKKETTSRLCPRSCRSACFEESDNDTMSSIVPTSLSSSYKRVISSSFLNEYTINRNRNRTVLAKLRHDASILYNYKESPSVYPVSVDAMPKKTSIAVAQAIIDAAVTAMRRCDETVLGREQSLMFPA